MIALFTDFGLSGPYTGQVKAVFAEIVPTVPVIDLFADAPAANPRAAAYLLAAYDDVFPAGTIFLTVVDPGVGTARLPIVMLADDRWYVGPDNGLLAIVARRAGAVRVWEITWRPPHLSASFHGRDLFAPAAARLALGEAPPGTERSDGLAVTSTDWPDDLAEVVYVDHYGNAFTGYRATKLSPRARLTVGGQSLVRARTFGDLPAGTPFWYQNSNGLAEIAVSGGRADRMLGIGIGAPVQLETP
jgi:S-adenosylmethionine hydrolase